MQSVKETVELLVDGETHQVQLDPDTPLLYVLRNQLAKNGPKYGCGIGMCGACMVLMDQQAVMSCVLPVSAAAGKEVLTPAGLIQADGALHPVQQAFIDEQAAQCGYCTNGMIISAVSLLAQNTDPQEQDIRDAMQINLCRCGSQSRVMRAVKRAAQEM